MTIINANAAQGRAVKIMPKLKKIVSANHHDYDWIITHSTEEMQSLISDAAKSGFTGILVAGGDGTVAGALPAVLNAGLPLGVIPCGRGNDFARNLGLPLNINDAALYPDRPNLRLVDIPTANDRPYASVASLGFDARVNELAQKPNRIFAGRSVYIYAVLKTLQSFTPFHVSLLFDHHLWQGSVMMVAVANGCGYGGGMKIAPTADMADGLLNICIVRKTGKLALLKEFPKVFRGKHTSHPNVVTLTARTVTLTADSEQKVFADGEMMGYLPLTCSVSKHRLKILEPKGNH